MPNQPQPVTQAHEQEEPAPSLSADNGQLLVVGIGASAGGLDAIGELMRHVASDVAYIVVQHLAPDHESFLTQLLARSSAMQFVTAADGLALQSNHVYVIPPNADLAVERGVLRLTPPSGSQRPHLPIDNLFRSLAQDLEHAAIGVVLSGTGTDG
ncbi:MAG TPA: chemotaxis protein CheB, partial [Polyangiaceae bacterium]|nr:chemotaxis protein CheB [Polyangiaceae bacterium]